MVRVIPPVALSNGLRIPIMHMNPGKTTCIVGPSDSGKSEYCLYALGYPMAKSFSDDYPQVNLQKIGYVPTVPQHLFSGMKPTLRGELELTYQFLGRKIEDFDVIIQRLGLSNQLDQDPFTLSGGEAVKAAIAIVAAKAPLYWILDQIYDALAPSMRIIVREFFEECLSKNCSVLETHTRSPDWIRECQKCSYFLQDEPTRFVHYDKILYHKVPKELLLHETQLKLLQKSNSPFIEKKANHKNAGLSNPVFIESLKQMDQNIHAKDVIFQHPSSSFTLGPISLTCQAGECLALLGANGAGKTTALKILSGLLTPERGTIKFSKKILKKAKSWAQNILYSFQNPDDQLYLAKVRDELFFTSKILKQQAQEPQWIINTLALDTLLNRSPTELPISNRRLVTIASTFIASPPFIALDEPTATLDPTQIKQLVKLIKKYLSEGGAILLISHDYDFVGEVASRLVHVDDGKIKNEFLPENWSIETVPFAFALTRNTQQVTTSFQEVVARYHK